MPGLARARIQDSIHSTADWHTRVQELRRSLVTRRLPVAPSVMFWLGLDDFFLHAAFGGDPTKAPLTPTGPLPNGFDGQYAAAVGSLLASNPNLKGVVGNFPNIFAMPHFRAVAWNPIPLDAANATMVTTALANGYNGFLTQMAANGLITEAEKTARTLTYAAGSNPILISDETLTDLSPYMARASRCAPTLRKSETNKKHRYHSPQHGNSVGYSRRWRSN